MSCKGLMVATSNSPNIQTPNLEKEIIPDTIILDYGTCKKITPLAGGSSIMHGADSNISTESYSTVVLLAWTDK